MKNNRKQFTTTFIIGAVLLASIIVLVNMIFDNLNFGRFDFTSGRIYSISDASENILESLEAPITLTYYVSSSEKMPTKWKNLERDVIDILKELKLASKGKLDYTVFDPTVEEEKEAVAAELAAVDDKEKQQTEKRKKIAQRLYEKGVIPFGVQSTDRDEFAVKRVYSSIVLSYLDRKEDVIPEVRPESFGSLEYEIMSRIYKLVSNKKPRIAFYPGQPDIPPYMQQQYGMQKPLDMYELPVQMLKEAGYDVTRTNIKQDDPIPDNMTTLVVMVDQPLNERQMYEIEKSVHQGVNVVFAAQNYNYQISSAGKPGEYMLRGQSSRLNTNSMTRNWGFEVDNKIFMDSNSGFISVPVYQTRQMGQFQVKEQRYEPVSKPVVIQVAGSNINQDVSISNGISELFYLYGSRLNLVEEILDSESVTQNKMLFTSSDNAWTQSSNGYGAINTDKPADNELLDKQPLGIFIEGVFAAPLANQPKPAWAAVPGQETHTTSLDTVSEDLGQAQPAKIIAFGAANMFKSQVMQNIVSHRALLQNSVDALTLGDNLINIRSKNITIRRIQPTTMAGKFWAKFFVIWFMPLIFIAVGIYISVTRQKKILAKIKSLK